MIYLERGARCLETNNRTYEKIMTINYLNGSSMNGISWWLSFLLLCGCWNLGDLGAKWPAET